MAYPKRDAEQVIWWATFKVETADRALTFASILTAGILNNITACATYIAQLVNDTDAAKKFAREEARYKDIWLNSRLGTPVPARPVEPVFGGPPANLVVGFEAFARQVGAQLNAHPAMTDAIRAAMGIRPGPSPLGNVRIVRAEAMGGSQVALRLSLLGHDAVAVYRRRNGITERIGTSLRADFTDTDGPLVPGVSESREYWVRAIIDNVEIGPISAPVLVATTP